MVISNLCFLKLTNGYSGVCLRLILSIYNGEESMLKLECFPRCSCKGSQTSDQLQSTFIVKCQHKFHYANANWIGGVWEGLMYATLLLLVTTKRWFPIDP